MNPEKIPISEINEDDLADLHVKYAFPPGKLCNADLSDEAWKKVLENDQDEFERLNLIKTIENLSFTAKAVRYLCGDRDQIPADKTIGFVSDGGLDRDPRAAMIAVEAYQAFPKEDATADNVLEKLIDFFSILERTFAAMGVQT